jgi:hypothetical protein
MDSREILGEIRAFCRSYLRDAERMLKVECRDQSPRYEAVHNYQEGKRQVALSIIDLCRDLEHAR